MTMKINFYNGLTPEEYCYSPFIPNFCFISTGKLFTICQKNSIALDYPAMFMAKRSPLYYLVVLSENTFKLFSPYLLLLH